MINIGYESFTIQSYKHLLSFKLRIMMFFMSALKTLRLIVILFVIIWSMTLFNSFLYFYWLNSWHFHQTSSSKTFSWLISQTWVSKLFAHLSLRRDVRIYSCILLEYFFYDLFLLLYDVISLYSYKVQACINTNTYTNFIPLICLQFKLQTVKTNREIYHNQTSQWNPIKILNWKKKNLNL